MVQIHSPRPFQRKSEERLVHGQAVDGSAFETQTIGK